MEIKQLDKRLIETANNHSFYDRGSHVEQSYKSYIEEVMEWPIADAKKQRILNQVYTKYTKILDYEAKHVPVTVAGPANYNSKKLDKSDKIMKTSKEFYEWFDELREQVKNGQKEDSKDEKVKYIMQGIKRLIELKLDPTKDIMSLATIDNQKFIEVFDELYPKFKWRSNSNIFKLYARSLNGEVKEIKKEIIFEDENLEAYIEGERAYIKFPMKVQQQLIYALKKKGWFWNSHKGAWSTYLDRVDREWIENISNKYEKYL